MQESTRNDYPILLSPLNSRRVLFSSSAPSVIPLSSDASSLFQDMALKKTQHRKENQKCTIPKKKIVILLQ